MSAATLPGFRYSTPTIEVGGLTLDAQALNTFIARAESLYGTGVEYALSGQNWKGAEEVSPGTKMDCTGFCWWSTYRNRQTGGLWPANKNWLELPGPVAGCAVRRSALPGQKHGHAGMVIAVGGGDFSTLDSSSTDPKPRAGAIRFVQSASALWQTKPECRFVVSNQAVIAVNGAPYKRPLNIQLAIAKRPIESGLAALALIAGGFWYWRRSRRV